MLGKTGLFFSDAREKTFVRSMKTSLSNSMIDAWLSCNGFSVFRTAHLVKNDTQPPLLGVFRISLMKVKVCVCCSQASFLYCCEEDKKMLKVLCQSFKTIVTATRKPASVVCFSFVSSNRSSKSLPNICTVCHRNVTWGWKRLSLYK